jgi:hypothetical protein
LPAYWLANIRWDRRIIVNVVIISAVLYAATRNLDFIARYLTSSASEKVGGYLEMTSEELMADRGTPILYLIQGGINRVILLLFPMVMLRKRLGGQTLEALVNLQIFGALLFAFLALDGPIFTRFCRYFDIISALSLPVSMFLVSKKNFVRLMFLGIAAFSIFKLIFMLYNDKQVYVPYQSVL